MMRKVGLVTIIKSELTDQEKYIRFNNMLCLITENET